MSSTDNRTEIRYVCGKPIRVTYITDVSCYGEYGQKFVTYYWEDAEIGVMDHDYWNQKNDWSPLNVL